MNIKTDPFKFIKNLVDNYSANIVYIPNPGNLGDSLIIAATIQNFEKYNIPFSFLEGDLASCHKEGNVYVYGGGGNYIPLYTGCAYILDQISEVRGKCILLPHSSYGMNNHLKNLKCDLTFFARDLDTFNNILESNSNIDLYLSDDVAISTDLSDPRFINLHRYQWVTEMIPSEHTLYSMRCDDESKCDFRTRKDLAYVVNHEISSWENKNIVTFNGFDTFNLFDDVSRFATLIMPFSNIHTDRLHVCILGVLLGKKIFFYNNIYNKNYAVYENSLKDLFSGQIVLMDHF